MLHHGEEGLLDLSGVAFEVHIHYDHVIGGRELLNFVSGGLTILLVADHDFDRARLRFRQVLVLHLLYDIVSFTLRTIEEDGNILFTSDCFETIRVAMSANFPAGLPQAFVGLGTFEHFLNRGGATLRTQLTTTYLEERLSQRIVAEKHDAATALGEIFLLDLTAVLCDRIHHI